jgi:hypothetical protein
MRDADPPAGYVQCAVGPAHVVCMEGVADATRAALRDGTLYEFAQRHPRARAFAGRGVSFAVPLPGNVERVVVRHNRHGGLLAPMTGDLFRPPTRAPLELRVSHRLRELGVRTPLVIGYVRYPASRGLERADVMTREFPNSTDLSAAVMSDDPELRRSALLATADLILALERAGARHHDLNIKNVLLQSVGGALEAIALDVDRVTFASAGQSVIEANLARILRSARKWQTLQGARVTDTELADFTRSARERSAGHLATLS